MRIPANPTPRATGDISVVADTTLKKLQREEDGTTAIEFAMICIPFITMLLGIMSVCLYFFTVLELENAVWAGSRDVRVGTYGKGTDGYSKPTADPRTEELFKQEKLKESICNRMRDRDYCMGKLRVLLQSKPTISNAAAVPLEQPDCRINDPSSVDHGKLKASDSFETTGASSFVVLTGCYTWDFGGQLPFFKIGNMPDGSFLVQATFAFVNEQYN